MKLCAITCICNCFHWAAAIWLHLYLTSPDTYTDCGGMGKQLHLQFCAHQTGTNAEAQPKTNVFAHQNKRAAVPLPNCAGNFPCAPRAGNPSHSCFPSWLTRSSKATDVSLQESINTRAEGWTGLKRKLKAKAFSEYFCKCHCSALPFLPRLPATFRRGSTPVSSSRYTLNTRYFRLALQPLIQHHYIKTKKCNSLEERGGEAFKTLTWRPTETMQRIIAVLATPQN